MTTFHPLDLSRRRLLRGATIAIGAGALAAITLVASPASAGAKFSQKMAQYQPTPKGPQNGGNCVQFQPDTACKVVDGKVAASGWCMLYSPTK